MKKAKSKGVLSMQGEGYHLPQKNEKKYQRIDQSWWQCLAILLLFTAVFTALDGFVLFGLFDAILIQSKNMGIIVTVGISLTINFIPLLIAKYLFAVQDGEQNKKKYVLIAIITFVLIYAATCYLRYTCQNMYLPVSFEIGTQSTEQHTEAEISQSWGIVLLYCVSPLATSVINFLLAYSVDNPQKRNEKYLRIRRLELYEAIAEQRAALQEMDASYADMLATEIELYKSEKADVWAWENQLRADARLALAMYLETPEAISKLSSLLSQVEKPIEKPTKNEIIDFNGNVG